MWLWPEVMESINYWMWCIKYELLWMVLRTLCSATCESAGCSWQEHFALLWQQLLTHCGTTADVLKRARAHMWKSLCVKRWHVGVEVTSAPVRPSSTLFILNLSLACLRKVSVILCSSDTQSGSDPTVRFCNFHTTYSGIQSSHIHTDM